MPAERQIARNLVSANRRNIIQPQLPFLLSILIAAAAEVIPMDVSTETIAAIVITILSSVAITVLGIAIPWSQVSPKWVLAIPLLDIAVVAMSNTYAFADFQGSEFLITVPILWMVYGFSQKILPLTFIAPLLVALVPYITSARMPSTVRDWSDVLGFAILVGLAATSLSFSAARFRRGLSDAATASAISKEFLAEVQDREVTLNAVLDTVDASIALFDPDGGVILANATGRAMAQHAGSTVDGLENGIPLLYELDGVTVPSTEQYFESGYRDGASEIAPKTFLVGPPGNQLAVQVRMRQVLRPSGEPLGSVVVTHDVTDLIDALHIRDEFLMSVSHELRTPLTSIIGYLEIIEDSVDAKALGFDSALSIVQRNSARLLALISDLMATAEERVALVRKPVDLAELVAHAVETAGPNGTSSGVTVTGGPFTTVFAELDRGRISQVLDNLMSNAVKYTPAGGTVTVSLESNGDGASVHITDTGVGMSPRDQRQIFERFFRADSARRGAIPGVGVGLSIAKTYVDAHNGSISVDSVLGEGTTMSVWLPLTNKKDMNEPVTGQFSAI